MFLSLKNNQWNYLKTKQNTSKSINFQASSQLCTKIFTLVLLWHKSKNCSDLTQRLLNRNEFLFWMNKRGSGMSWKEDPGPAPKKGERTTTAEAWKYKGSFQINCTGKTNYFIWIKESILKAVVLHPGGTPYAPTEIIWKFWGHLGCKARYAQCLPKGQDGPINKVIIQNVNSSPQHMLW